VEMSSWAGTGAAIRVGESVQATKSGREGSAGLRGEAQD
jgi:hypothetical protein